MTAINPIGVTAVLRWFDMPEDLVFEEYISFGKYDPDEENDGLGVNDFEVFAYADSIEHLEQMKYTSEYDWRLVTIKEVHYE
jgi:hypothetical protein